MSQRKRKRDSCEICKVAGRNPTGHTAEYCAFPGGPYPKDLDRAKAARKESERNKVNEKKEVVHNYAALSSELVSQSESVSTRLDKVELTQQTQQTRLEVAYQQIARLDATVQALTVRLAQIEDRQKAQGSIGSVAQGSKGKGKGKGKGRPASYFHYDSWDY